MKHGNIMRRTENNRTIPTNSTFYLPNRKIPAKSSDSLIVRRVFICFNRPKTFENV